MLNFKLHVSPYWRQWLSAILLKHPPPPHTTNLGLRPVYSDIHTTVHNIKGHVLNMNIPCARTHIQTVRTIIYYSVYYIYYIYYRYHIYMHTHKFRRMRKMANCKSRLLPYTRDFGLRSRSVTIWALQT